MRLFALILSVVVLAAAPTMARDAKDRTFDANRVGVIVKGKTKPVDLARLFGRRNVSYEKIGYEGGESPGAMIFRGTPDQLEVMFSDDGKRIVTVSINGRNWKSAAGLHTGLTVDDLERLNGGPFDFQGFGADEAGRVSAAGPALNPFTIYFGFVDVAPEALRDEAVFSSRHPALKGVKTRVHTIVVTLYP